MSIPNRDCIAIMDRAIESEKGIRIKVKDKNTAIALRHRCYRMRAKERKENRARLPIEHPMYDRSIFDELFITIDETPDGVYLAFRKGGLNLNDLILAAEDLDNNNPINPEEM